MNLYLRMIWLLVSSLFKPDLPARNPVNGFFLRVLPNDIDINLHMNNGRYLTICDLTRVDMFIRSGLARTMMIEKWMPVISEHTMRYKRPLRMFQKYHVKMHVVDWDDRVFNLTHSFVVNNKIVAHGTSKGVIVGKDGVVPPEQVIKTVEQRLAKKRERKSR